MKCLRLKGIKKSMKKLSKQELNGKKTEGTVIHIPNRGGEDRYEYIYNNKQIFSFGLSRGTKRKELPFFYVPIQMGLNNKEYKEFHDCDKSKEELNNLLIEREKI